MDILIIKSNSLKQFRNILQSSKKSPYQRNDEINKNFRPKFFRTTILLYKNELKSVTVPRFTIFLKNSYIILLFVNFTTLPYFASTGEHLVKIWLKSDSLTVWYWARSSNFPQNAKRVSCNLNWNIYIKLKFCTIIKNPTNFASINSKDD